MFEGKIAKCETSTHVSLEAGSATHMGEGAFMVFQADENEVVQSLYLTASDLAAMLAYRA